MVGGPFPNQQRHLLTIRQGRGGFNSGSGDDWKGLVFNNGEDDMRWLLQSYVGQLNNLEGGSVYPRYIKPGRFLLNHSYSYGGR